MDYETDRKSGAERAEESAGKPHWTRPEVRRLTAGSAEAGSNPVNPEGLFEGS